MSFEISVPRLPVTKAMVQACAYYREGSSTKLGNVEYHCFRRRRHLGLCRAPVREGQWIQWKRVRVRVVDSPEVGRAGRKLMGGV